MYVVISENPLKITTFEAKTDLSNWLGVHRHTITNRFKASNGWESDKGRVFESNLHHKRNRKGNKEAKLDTGY